MMNVTVCADTSLPDHREAMRLGATEYERLIALLHSLEPEDWLRGTDCALWDVKAMVAHLLGNMEGNASMRELTHQIGTAKKRAKARGSAMVDELTSLQIFERASLTPDELVSRIQNMAAKAVKGRRRVPGLLRRFVRIDAAPFGRIPLGYLVDTVYTRDVWMHRIDISRAAHHPMVLDPLHDGRLVAAIVGDWAGRHGQPYELVLDGPAGASFSRGSGGEPHHLDAIEFCRIVSGRDAASAQGLLLTEVLY